jgi:hypothetical protein
MDEENFVPIQEVQDGNITGLWHKDIYDSIRKIQDYERICRDGAVGIMEYLQVPHDRLAEMQFQFLRTMATELNILMGNVKVLLSEHFFIMTTSKIKTILHNIDRTPMMFISVTVNQQSHTTSAHITENYILTLREISRIREELVVHLTSILFGKPNEKASGMDKTITQGVKELIR